MLSYWQAIWMAVVQGLTEFLPVSSSGHLVLASQILDIQTDGGPLLEVILHIGTLIAVFIVYYKDVWSLIKEGVLLIIDGVRYLVNKAKYPFRMYPERKMVVMVLIASVPTAVLGLFVEAFLQDLFMSSTIAVGVMLLVTSALLLLSTKIKQGSKRVEKATYRDALAVGIVQGIATMPGISRSGSTIVAGLAGGFDREFAIRFSFLISIPAIAGASLLTFIKADLAELAANAGPYLVGLVLSAAVGYLCIRTLLRMLKNHTFHYFGYYCGAVGVIAIICGLVM